MRIVIRSTSPHKGFWLPEPVEFDGFLSVMTGKNGSGKTRLLESLKNNHAEISIDGELTDHRKISIIDINSHSQTVFSPYYKSNSHRLLTEGIHKLIQEHESSEEIPENHPIAIHEERRMDRTELFNAKRIIKNAEFLFLKEMKELELKELELSVFINKEMINSQIKAAHSPLSELTVNDFITRDLIKYLKFLISEGEKLNEPREDVLNKYLEEESPHLVFNKIIKKLFRGKYSVSPPNIKRATLEYAPKLIVNHSGDEIDPQQLSSGEKTIFWLAEKTFYTTNARSDFLFGETTIILMDEPDSHLHPQMVSDFYDCLYNLHKTLNIIFIFTTHSPTTVALCPNDNIFKMSYDARQSNYSLTHTDKDGAISELLEGISQISVNPDNSRQVYVENANDSHIYEKIYTFIKNKSPIIDPKINLSFISAGPKIADSELSKHIESVYGESDKTKQLLEKINGDGNCQQVIGMVEYLTTRGNKTVRGLIDWDNTTRKHNDKVIVFAKDYAYSIENIIYDPLSIYAYLTCHHYKSPSFFINVETDFQWRDALSADDKMQSIVDFVTEYLLGRPNKKDHIINYMNGVSLKGDKEYFIPKKGSNGHGFEKIISEKFPEINRIKPKSSTRPMIYHFSTIATLGCLGDGFINKVFEDAISNLQK